MVWDNLGQEKLSICKKSFWNAGKGLDNAIKKFLEKEEQKEETNIQYQKNVIYSLNLVFVIHLFPPLLSVSFCNINLMFNK